MEHVKISNEKESDTKTDDVTKTIKYTIVMVKLFWPVKVFGMKEVE